MKPAMLTCPACGHHLSSPSSRVRDTRRTRGARALARHLAVTLNIPDDDRLVFIFGSGREKSNHQAIEHWVHARLERIDRWPLPADEVQELVTELEREARRLLADLEQGRFHV